MRYLAFVSPLSLALLLLPSSSGAQTQVAGVLSLTPVEENSCLATQLEVNPGDPVVAVRWYNNDGTQPFQRLLLMEGQAGVAPDVSQTGLVLADVSGPGLAWGEVQLEFPVSSTTGVIDAVFELPPYTERVGEGDGGGSGIGYYSESGTGFISRDGTDWVQVSRAVRLAVDLVVGSSKSANVASLGDLVGTVEDGWWKHARPRGPDTGPVDGEATKNQVSMATPSSPLVIAPNPFNPRTEISFYLPKPGRTKIEVYDMRGRLVRVLTDSVLEAGAHDRIWDGRDGQAGMVASGVYFIRLKGPDLTEVSRAILVR